MAAPSVPDPGDGALTAEEVPPSSPWGECLLDVSHHHHAHVRDFFRGGRGAGIPPKY